MPEKSDVDSRACFKDDDFEIYDITIARLTLRYRSPTSRSVPSLFSQVPIPAPLPVSRFSAHSAVFSAPLLSYTLLVVHPCNEDEG